MKKIICKSKTFDSTYKILGRINDIFPQEVVKNEPMFFNSSIEFAYKNGGPLTKAFIDAIPVGWENSVLDSRVHMLMPDWYPAIPGWHHDDIPRSKELNGQPDYENLRYKSEHIMCLLGAETSLTEFAVGQIKVPEIYEDEVIYGEWTKKVESLVRSGKVKSLFAQMNEIIYFDHESFHQATASHGNGFRWFVRISKNTEREKTITNEFRKQSQVYMSTLTSGW